jgi:hypothetical protein
MGRHQTAQDEDGRPVDQSRGAGGVFTGKEPQAAHSAASMVVNSVGTSTPLRGGRSTVAAVMPSTPSVSDFLGITDRRNATFPLAFPASRWPPDSRPMTK